MKFKGIVSKRASVAMEVDAENYGEAATKMRATAEEFFASYEFRAQAQTYIPDIAFGGKARLDAVVEVTDGN